MTNNTLTALNGISVGHATQLEKLTGCTYIHFDNILPVAYKAYGGAIGAYSTEGLKSTQTNYKENGIFISGGSITGLGVATEITKALVENKIGMKVGENVYNPSIAGAIIWDQGMNIAQFDPSIGRIAFDNLSKEPVQAGNVGAGTGASVGKFRWIAGGKKSGAMKSGLGNARIDVGGGIIVTALSVVNAMGNIVLPNGEILAGNRDEHTKFKPYEDMVQFVMNPSSQSNTTISVIGINVDLKYKQHYERVAHLASHGQVRAINPVHTSADGDSIFVFSTEEVKEPFNHYAKYFQQSDDSIYMLVDIVGHAAAKAVQESIYDACRSAETVAFEEGYQGIFPSCNDYS